ncbi:MAG: AAA family ATPase [Eubacteriales bacterium]|nr:AAA family ATPase [Eubacteriales bacterium]
MALSKEQREAVLAAAEGGLTVVTGGPGTGKTTCIRCMLEVLSFAGKTVLCAPTGRAAKRMSEASGCEAKTIHRLLEYGGEEGSFLKNELDPIDAQVVIVDEVSMVDLQLMRALLRALRPGVRLVFVGDKDQLPPVGAGNVLADLIRSGVAPVIFLTRIYRQGDGSRIVDNAHRINAGEMPVCNGKDSDFFFERYDTPAEAAQAVVRLVSQRLPGYLGANPLTAIQTMAPMKKGDAGVWRLNALLQQALNPADGQENELRWGDSVFRPGDRVMQIRNNYQKEWLGEGQEGKGVFNGDIGFVAQVDKESRSLKVLFDENRLVEYDDAELDDLELAYCISVHKSQGGEFDCIVLPLVSGPPMLMTRNLLYTAVTRAKKLVVLVGRGACVSAMVKNDHVAQRYSGLAERLARMTELAQGMRRE